MPTIADWEWLGDWIAPILLVGTRVAGLVAIAPVVGTPGLDWRIRLGLIGLLTCVVAPLVGPGIQANLGEAALRTPASWAWPLANEGLVGAALGLTMALVIAAGRQAGELIGSQSGLSGAAAVDPESPEESNPLGHLFGLVALGTFLAVGGPMRLIGALVESYQAVPAGASSLGELEVVWMFGRIGWSLGLSLRAAAPAAVGLIVANVLLSWIGRAASGLTLDPLAAPARVAIGLILASLGLAGVAGVSDETWSAILPVPSR